MVKLNYTRNGKHKVMITFENGPTFIHSRFDTLEEAEHVINSFKNDPSSVNQEINAGSEMWLEIED